MCSTNQFLMKSLTKEQLDTVREMAARLMHPSLIAIAVDMPEVTFTLSLKDPSTELYKAYYEGFIQSKMNLQEAIIKSALNGSTPSQTEMKKYIKEAEDFINA